MDKRKERGGEGWRGDGKDAATKLGVKHMFAASSRKYFTLSPEPP
jgi:hypothetical protein